MASFQAKIGWEMPRKRKNKYFISVPFRPDGQQKIPKNEKKIQKNQKIPLWLHFKPKQVGKGREIEKIKMVVPFRSHPTRNRKFQKNSKKFKNSIMASFQAKISRKRLTKRENKNYRFVSFRSYPTGNRKFQKKQQKD